MKHILLIGLALVLGSNCFFVRADEAPLAQMETGQRELCVLLAKANPNSFNSNSPALPRSGNDFSPYLTKSENIRLAELLRIPEIAKTVTCELALAAVKQRQLDDSLPGFQYNALMDLVNQRWPHDAAVIAFYREAMATRGEVAIFDLFSPLPGIWDDSLLEPVIHMMEKKWDEWDGKIAELQKQLDALGSALQFIRTNQVDTAPYEMMTPEAVQRISTEGTRGWRVSWRHQTPKDAAVIKGGQLVIIVHDSGKIEKVFSE
jgi:hypothetical protein